jgi:hypothetical protein
MGVHPRGSQTSTSVCCSASCGSAVGNAQRGLDSIEATTRTRHQFGALRYIEWQVRRLTIKNGNYIDERGKFLLEEKAGGGRRFTLGDAVADYAVWLLKARDCLSWHQIACRFFPSATEEEIGKYELRIRRVYDRVERSHPGSEAFEPPPLSKSEKVLLEAVMMGVMPIEVACASDDDSEVP